MNARLLVLVLLASIALFASQAEALFGRRTRWGLVPPPEDKLQASASVVSGWFTQKLDHFNPQERRTFNQRYFLNADYFNQTDPKAPVFLFLGGEGELRSTWVTQGTMFDLGKKFGALLIALEHRYYGDSHPFTDLSTPNLAWLSSQQALADYAYFSQVFENGAYSGRRWYAFGGSYSGGLAGWLRMKYPTFFHGSLASSGPVDPVIEYWQYFDVVQNALQYYGGADCVNDFTTATNEVDSMVKTAPQDIAQKLNLCYAPNKFSTDMDLAGLWETMIDTFAGIVQYNKDGAPVSVRTVCQQLKQAPRKSDAFLAIIKSQLTPGNCTEWDYRAQLAPIANQAITTAGNMRQWIYQTCTEFGYYQTTSQKVKIIPSDKIPLSFFINLCKDAFGITYDLDYIKKATRDTVVNYGSTDIPVSNVIWTNGNIDPWHVLSVLDKTPSQPDTMTLMMIEGTSHCASLYAPGQYDTDSLKKAREQIADIFAGYLAQP